MISLSAIQENFSAELFRVGLPVASEHRAIFSKMETLDKRFAVYRNNMHHSLIQAVEDSFPVVRGLIGEDAFKATVQAFILARPPQSAVLMSFTSEFPEFLATFEPLTKYSYLGDVASLEIAWLNAYQAKTEPALTPEALQSLSADQLNQLLLIAHPSLQLLASHFSVGTIWQAHQSASNEAKIDISQPEFLALSRRGVGLEMQVELYFLDAPGFAFINNLKSGKALAPSIESCIESYPDWNPSESLAFMLQHEFFSIRSLNNHD